MIQDLKMNKIVIIAAHGFDVKKYQVFDEIVTLDSGHVTKVELSDTAD
jgi:ABC-type transport system involved in cytochrome bd biosynthesis fused ATPase/permease subunit